MIIIFRLYSALVLHSFLQVLHHWVRRVHRIERLLHVEGGLLQAQVADRWWVVVRVVGGVGSLLRMVGGVGSRGLAMGVQ